MFFPVSVLYLLFHPSLYPSFYPSTMYPSIYPPRQQPKFIYSFRPAFLGVFSATKEEQILYLCSLGPMNIRTKLCISTHLPSSFLLLSLFRSPQSIGYQILFLFPHYMVRSSLLAMATGRRLEFTASLLYLSVQSYTQTFPQTQFSGFDILQLLTSLLRLLTSLLQSSGEQLRKTGIFL